jgi:hypothetical protein
MGNAVRFPRRWSPQIKTIANRYQLMKFDRNVLSGMYLCLFFLED